ncbi:DMT family transporter [Myroides odoratimimus]|uniref:EamA/RhaT family transporter n=1 Tax=Myroides odoratimimus TaxID=76832 RepID=UPI002575C36C|nr:EamA/RhaT family transporter [Myroides odoratimimus]MDM1098115.1 DMT family transporter [Myroides odoratimimus]MDM1328284.1 DMT family transporter [Myroides odoratimimus]MDM1445001.1 DMT family transporter [Myroides odoratimimus]MDM1451287.1 DMT family transporter [Myroides odoratimimus]MDM1454417.1 DMT family transporter [Myroides odoratimimus]
MLYLILSILSSISVGVLFKVLKKQTTNIFQIIVLNYIVTVFLSFLIFKPSSITINAFPIFLIIGLGVLLPSIFLAQYLSIKNTGIIKTDIAQRMSLFIPILASVFIFKENITNLKYIALLIGFISIGLILNKNDHKEIKAKNNYFYLLLVFIGFGVIDVCFKQVALYSTIPYTSTLFYIFSCSLILSLIFYTVYIKFKKIKFEIAKKTMLFGLLVGLLNFINIYFYLNAHKAFADNPTVVFAGMNYGVILLGTLIGYFYFNEKLNKYNVIGLGFAVLSIGLLIISQVII